MPTYTKVQMKRTKSGPNANFTGLDRKFVNGSIAEMPQKGENVVFYFNRLGKGWWVTTTITKQVRKRKGLIIFKTQNSEYHLRLGWRT